MLEVLDAAGQLVRRFSSDDAPEPPLEGRNIPDLLDPAAPGPLRRGRDAPLRVGPALPAAAGAEASRSTRSRRWRGNTPTAPAGAVGAAGRVHACASPRREDRDPAAHGEDGPAGEDAAPPTCRRSSICRRSSSRPWSAWAEPCETAPKQGREGLAQLQGQLAQLYEALQDVDAAPTVALTAAVRDRLGALDLALTGPRRGTRPLSADAVA